MNVRASPRQMTRSVTRAAPSALFGDSTSWVLTSGTTKATLDIDFTRNLAYSSSASRSIASLLTCTRASSGYYQNADGTLQSFSSNVLRYGSNGLLVEESRTNLSRYSQQPSTYSLGNTATTDNTTTAPDGTLTGGTFAINNGAAVHRAYDSNSAGTLAAATVYAVSIYAKYSSLQYLGLNISGDANCYSAAVFDLVNGTVGDQAVGGSGGTITSASITALANGWYRCVLVGKCGGAGNGSFTIFGAPQATSNTFTSAGDISYTSSGSKASYIWQSDLQAGAFPTSPIVTTSGSATRAADVVAFASVSWLSQVAGTTYCDYLTPPTGASISDVYEIAAAARADCSVEYNGYAAGDFDSLLVKGAAFSTQAQLATASHTTNTRFKHAAAFTANDFASSLDAAAALTDGAGTFPAATLTQAALGGQTGGGAYLNSYLKRFSYWGSRLSNGALQTLTTPTLNQSSDPFILNSQIANLDIDFVNNIGYLNPGALTGYTNTATIASLLTCTRASSGYYQNADGTLTSFGSNVLRYGSNGLLVEEARTNLALYSNTFSNAVWTKQDTYDSSFLTTTTGPDGVAGSASKLTENTNLAGHDIYQAYTKAASAITYTFTVYAKAAERSRINLTLYDHGFAGYANATFDLSGVQIGVATAASGMTAPSASITALANGWCRCTLTATSGAFTDLYTIIYLDANTGTQGGNGNYAGTNGNGIYIFGVMLEAGSFATSYIPTTSGSVTRAADNITFASQAFWNKITGTYYGQATPGDVSVDTRIWGQNFNGTYLGATGNTFANWYDNTNSQTATAGSGGWATTAKAASAFDTGASSICMNNGTVVTSATVDFSSATTLYVGSNNAFNAFLNGYVKRMSYWNTKLSNAALGVLTT